VLQGKNERERERKKRESMNVLRCMQVRPHEGPFGVHFIVNNPLLVCQHMQWILVKFMYLKGLGGWPCSLTNGNSWAKQPLYDFDHHAMVHTFWGAVGVGF
jgi:hypothetical protein